jgi:hypothetical protein
MHFYLQLCSATEIVPAQTPLQSNTHESEIFKNLKSMQQPKVSFIFRATAYRISFHIPQRFKKNPQKKLSDFGRGLSLSYVRTVRQDKILKRPARFFQPYQPLSLSVSQATANATSERLVGKICS